MVLARGVALFRFRGRKCPFMCSESAMEVTYYDNKGIHRPPGRPAGHLAELSQVLADRGVNIIAWAFSLAKWTCCLSHCTQSRALSGMNFLWGRLTREGLRVCQARNNSNTAYSTKRRATPRARNDYTRELARRFIITLPNGKTLPVTTACVCSRASRTFAAPRG